MKQNAGWRVGLACLFLTMITYASPLFAGEATQTLYDRVDIRGYYKNQLVQLNASPAANFFTASSVLGGSQYSLSSAGPWRQQLQLTIEGKLSDDISLSYDIEQQPDLPQKNDIRLKLGETELSFGDLSSKLERNEFASVNKTVNGVMLSTRGKETDYNFTFVSAKDRSITQSSTTQKGANKTGPYSLGHNSIVEGSERIELNGVLLRRGADYTIDYFEGKVTFMRILSSQDEFRYSYEYTNFIDFLFPAISKRDFMGLQGSVKIDANTFASRQEPLSQPIVYATREVIAPLPLPTSEAATLTMPKLMLHGHPIEKFSEVVLVGGRTLKREDDYTIDYDTGELSLYHPPAKGETIEIAYSYYETFEFTEHFPVHGRGPYRFLQRGVVVGTEQVWVNNIPRFPGLDYAYDDIDPLKFSFLYDLPAKAEVTLTYLVKKEETLETTKPSPSPYTLTTGVTYLKESAKKSSGSVTVTVSEGSSNNNFTGEKIIANSNRLFLSNYPLDRSATVTVTVNGVATTTGWAIPTREATTGTLTPNIQLPYLNHSLDRADGYDTGTIAFTDGFLQASDQVTVTYTYKKSFVHQVTIQGNGSVGPYQLPDVTEMRVFSEQNVALRDQGATTTTSLTRNSSIEVADGDYAIAYRPDTGLPFIQFNQGSTHIPSNTQFIELTLYYIPITVAQKEDINRQIVGYDTSLLWGPNFRLDGTFATSRTDQVTTSTTTLETFAGQGSSVTTYTLANQNIIDGSERIFVNGQQLNRDDDYLMAYTAGSLTFLTIRPTAQDEIKAEYQYLSGTGVAQSSSEKVGNAFKLAGEMVAGPLSFSTNIRDVGKDFTPIGTTSLGQGKQRTDWLAKFQPTAGIIVSSTGFTSSERLGETSSGGDAMLRTSDTTTSLEFTSLVGGKGALRYRNFSSLDDPLATLASTDTNRRKSDNNQSVFFGEFVPASFQWQFVNYSAQSDFSLSTAASDTADQVAPATTNTQYFHLKNMAKMLGDRVQFSYDYKQNEPRTVATAEAVTKHERSMDHQYALDWDMTPQFLKKMAARLEFGVQDKFNFLANSLNRARNEGEHIDWALDDHYTLDFSHSRTESPTVLVQGRNPANDNANLLLTYQPQPWLTGSWQHLNSALFQENGNESDAQEDKHLLGYTPFRGERPWGVSSLKLDISFNSQNRRSIVSGGSVTVTKNVEWISQLGYQPIPFLALTQALKTQWYRNYTGTTSNVVYASSLESKAVFAMGPIWTWSARLAFENFQDRGSTSLGAQIGVNSYEMTMNLPNRFNLKTFYETKRTQNVDTADTKGRTQAGVKLDWAVDRWWEPKKFGVLTYEFSLDQNGGEFQSYILKTLDQQKRTHALTFQTDFPQQTAYLDQVLVDLTYKMIDYHDGLTTTNSYVGSLLVFEVTFNF